MLIAQNRIKLLTCLMIAGSVLVIGCGLQQEDRLPEQTLAAEPQAIQLPEVEQLKGPHKGVSLSPRSFQSDDFTDFFLKAKQTGESVMWAGDWIELKDVEGNAPRITAELATVYNYIPLIEVQFFTQSSGALVRPLDESTRQIYLDSAVNFAQKYKPQYLGLGIEVNILYEKSPEDFNRFVRFFDDVYGAVKAVSPNTKIFTVFQLERMKGLQGGLFGGTNDTSNAQWQLLDSFPKSDLVAFSTYPGLIYKTPSEIPVDYYAEVKSHTAKAIAFTEIGWHSDVYPVGWESSEAEQAEFVRTFFNLTKELNLEMAIWSFMYDQKDIDMPFNSMGLRYRSDGTAKLAWNEWINAQIR